MPSDHEIPEQDLLVSGGAEPAPRRGRGKLLAIAAAGVLAAGAAGGGAYAAAKLGGGGAQPEDVLPRDAIGFVKVDLDPAAGQKLAAYRFAKKFPDSGVKGQDSVGDDLLRALLAPDQQADYDADVKPWLGKRAGVAVLAPPAAGPGGPVVSALRPAGGSGSVQTVGMRLAASTSSTEPDVVAAVQFTDRKAAQAGLSRLAAQVEDDGEQLHYAFAEGEDYVLLAEEQAVADRAAAGQEHLADDPRFTEGVEALEGDQIALGWLDVGALVQALPDATSAFGGRGTDLDPSGVVVFGAHLADDAVEVLGRTIGLTAGSSPGTQELLFPLGGGAPSGLISQLPADSLGAFGATGLGEGLASLYDRYAGDLERDEDVQAVLDELGVRLPEDLRAVLGDEVAVAVGGDLSGDAPTVALRVATGDPARGVELAGRVRDLVAEQDAAEAAEIDVRTVDGGYAATYGLGGITRSTSRGQLGDSEVFRRTVPDVERSAATYYLDVPRLLEQVDAITSGSAAGTGDGLSGRERADLAPLQAVGWTTTRDGDDVTIRLRVTASR